MMGVLPELLLCLFVHTCIYAEFQMERAGDHCTLTRIYIHSSSCRLLEACCPASWSVGWNRRDTQGLFESGAEFKLLGAERNKRNQRLPERSRGFCVLYPDRFRQWASPLSSSEIEWNNTGPCEGNEGPVVKLVRSEKRLLVSLRVFCSFSRAWHVLASF